MKREGPVIINVVSGKGGTGKSLLCAVLGRLLAQESARILLVDLDVHVRGLTYFFYVYSKEKRKITRETTIADFLGLSRRRRGGSDLAKERFYEVDLLPSVSEMEEQLRYFDIEPKKIEKIEALFEQLRRQPYDYVIVDNRSGVDDLVLTSCHKSDVTISVSESDPIALMTNDNLLTHLSSENVGKVYSIINKIPFLKSFEDYERESRRYRGDFTVVGQIPFDIDLFESFGKSRLWDIANSTRYAYALAESWNKLAAREDLDLQIDMNRFQRSRLWGAVAPTFLNRFERVSLVMGVACIVLYYVYERFLAQGFRIVDALLVYAMIFFSVPLLRRVLTYKRK